MRDSCSYFVAGQCLLLRASSLTDGKPEVSCNNLVDMHLGRQSASLTKEFYNFFQFSNDIVQNNYCKLPYIRISHNL